MWSVSSHESLSFFPDLSNLTLIEAQNPVFPHWKKLSTQFHNQEFPGLFISSDWQELGCFLSIFMTDMRQTAAFLMQTLPTATISKFFNNWRPSKTYEAWTDFREIPQKMHSNVTWTDLVHFCGESTLSNRTPASYVATSPRTSWGSDSGLGAEGFVDWRKAVVDARHLRPDTARRCPACTMRLPVQ